MVSSMTGFGRGRAAQDGREMTVELKALTTDILTFPSVCQGIFLLRRIRCARR